VASGGASLGHRETREPRPARGEVHMPGQLDRDEELLRIPKTSEIRFPFVETKENGQPDQS
jgi:hypothetical protein